MVAIELVGPDGITPDKAATARVAAACHAQGVLVLSGRAPTATCSASCLRS